MIQFVKIPKVTIFVHGTMITSKAVEHFPNARVKTFLHRAMGLHKALDYPQGSYLYSMANILTSNSEQFQLEHFYGFGWPGTLSAKVRAAQGAQLYQALMDLHQSYRDTYGASPEIT